jgi:hypothetical protein
MDAAAVTQPVVRADVHVVVVDEPVSMLAKDLKVDVFPNVARTVVPREVDPAYRTAFMLAEAFCRAFAELHGRPLLSAVAVRFLQAWLVTALLVATPEAVSPVDGETVREFAGVVVPVTFCTLAACVNVMVV